jgi:two-component system, chemotaxis family, sensor kinase CheA
MINEFLAESHTNLTRFRLEIVQLEQQPGDPALLTSIFRTMHTIRKTCGFLFFSNLEAVTSLAEKLLRQLRSGERILTPQLTLLVLEAVEVVSKELKSIEITFKETGESYADLRGRLTASCDEVVPAADEPHPIEAVTPPALPMLEAAAVAEVAKTGVEEPMVCAVAEAPVTVKEKPPASKESTTKSGSRTEGGLLGKLATWKPGWL